MKRNHLAILLIGPILLACHSNDHKSKIANSTQDSIDQITTGLKKTMDGAVVKRIELPLNSVKTVEVLSVNKGVPVNNDETDDCRGWSLTADQIKNILKYFEQMGSEEQYLSYEWYPCVVKGKIKIDETTYAYYFGGGGTLTLQKNDTMFFYGFRAEKATDYFISGELTQKQLQQ